MTGNKTTKGNQFFLTDDAVKHIERRHGGRGQQDHSMADVNDIARVGYVLENYDSIKLGDGSSRTSLNRDGTPGKKVVLSKKINGTYFIVEAVPDSGKTWIVTAYITKNGVPQVPDANAPDGDAQNELASTPNESVAQNKRNVNQNPQLYHRAKNGG